MYLRILCLILLLWQSNIFAAEFPLPEKGNALVGQVQAVVTQNGDTFPSIAQRYDVTYTGLREANPNVDTDHLLPGTVLIIPSAYLLPNVPRQGIVINLAELRLYYFPKHKKVVYTYPVGIGIMGWNITPGEFKIIDKQKDPTWYIPPAVHEELRKKGFNLPNKIPPGPDNPLGGYMLRLSNWSYLIHGVVDPTTVGRRSSSGCFRLYPENIVALFEMVPIGTPVRIIDEPYKAGWQHKQLYLEAHVPLQEAQITRNDAATLTAIVQNAIGKHTAEINWPQVAQLADQAMGLPQEIGERK